MKKKPLKIAVIGGRTADKETLEKAYDLGQILAKRGYLLICGGRGGIMEAASKGAYESGGLTLGLLPGRDTSDANPWIKIALPTGVGLARNSIIACSADGAIAVGGEFGTLSEIAYCKQFGKPVCSLNSWNIKNLHQVNSAKEAIEYIEREIEK